jgi:hypothetical protein
VAAVQREADRLEQFGILQSRRVGRARLVKADTSSPLYEALARLVLLTFGPARVVGEELTGVDGIDGVPVRLVGGPPAPPRETSTCSWSATDRDAVHAAAL